MSAEEPKPSAPAVEQAYEQADEQEEADVADAEVTPPHPPNLRLARSRQFDGYLVDADGRALYMYTGDVAGSENSACLGACAGEWPAFDLASEVVPGPGVQAAEVTRIHRQDGGWQTAYKGFPLYYRAADMGTRAVGGDGHAGRWFVARDYLAFLSSSPHESAGGGALEQTILTDGFGRTLYICLDDQRRTDLSPASSACTGACLMERPPWFVAATLRSTVLPSILVPTALGSLLRADGGAQLTYAGWPLYYFRGDFKLGDTAGHNLWGWRAIDPVAFAAGP